MGRRRIGTKNEERNNSKEIMISSNLLIKESTIHSNVIFILLIVIEHYDLNYYER